MAYFLYSELAINYSWLQFVESYLICRRKPAFKNISVTSNDSLSLKLDQLVSVSSVQFCELFDLKFKRLKIIC